MFNIFFYSEDDQLDSAPQPGPSDASYHRRLPHRQVVSYTHQEEMLKCLQTMCATLEKMSDSLASISDVLKHSDANKM